MPGLRRSRVCWTASKKQVVFETATINKCLLVFNLLEREDSVLIINLTGVPTTPEQKAQGIVDPSPRIAKILARKGDVFLLAIDLALALNAPQVKEICDLHRHVESGGAFEEITPRPILLLPPRSSTLQNMLANAGYSCK